MAFNLGEFMSHEFLPNAFHRNDFSFSEMMLFFSFKGFCLFLMP